MNLLDLQIAAAAAASRTSRPYGMTHVPFARAASKPPQHHQEQSMMRRVFRSLVVVTTAIIGLLVTTTAAYAHYVYEKAWVYRAEYQCTQSRSEISHGDGGGFSKGDTASYGRTWILKVGWVWCGIYKRQPPFEIAHQLHLIKWNASAGVGYVCKRSAWKKNQGTTSKLTTKIYYGAAPDCGSGYYGTITDSVVWHDGAWRGKGMWSGWHYQPSSASLAAAQVAEEPEPAVDYNVTGIPSDWPVAGPDGAPVDGPDGEPVQVARPGVPATSPAVEGPDSTTTQEETEVQLAVWEDPV
ncbi:hypothetical protein [Nonomuraea sp. NPDC049725]|uniref:hypothetical protein n=1 Tax=Nonomuraea sp. NPDC049725 TaxID=3154508 RepID=UPI00341F17CA